MDHVEHFLRTGKLLNGTYYFDPPLIEYEIRQLHHIFGHIVGNKIILYPLSKDVEATGNYNFSRTLLWLDVERNKITGWQNYDTADDDYGEYELKDLTSIERWCQNEGTCIEPLRDGRLFLEPLTDTEDIFNQINN